MSSATKFVVAGAIVALSGGFLSGGVLTQQPSDERPPAAASASAASSPEATADAAPGRSVRSDLLPGVDLVTEEVEPGVYRVVSDGVRDLSRSADHPNRYLGGILDGNIVAGLDGSLWRLDRESFYRLGEATTHHWPKGIRSSSFRPGQTDIEVGPDGTVWLSAWVGVPGRNARTDILSYDGQTWSKRWRGAFAKRWTNGVEVQQDGTVWMAWSTNRAKKGEAASGPVRAARLGDDGWEVLPGRVEADHAGETGDVVVAAGGGSEVWLRPGLSGPLYRHDGEGWVVEETPDLGAVMRAAAGPDGTPWVRLNPDCPPEAPGCWGPSDVLARLDGGDWQVFDASAGVPRMGDHYQGFEGFFEVAPDRSVWFDPIGEDTECDGIADFDGKTVTSFLRDSCIFAMDIGTDGTVWLQAGDKARPDRIETYVITPEAVAASA